MDLLEGILDVLEREGMRNETRSFGVTEPLLETLLSTCIMIHACFDRVFIYTLEASWSIFVEVLKSVAGSNCNCIRGFTRKTIIV